MKRSWFVFALILATVINVTGAYAQKAVKETSGGIKFSGFGAPIAKMSQFHDQWKVLVGGAGGVLINDNIGIGLAGYGLAGTFDKEYNGTTNDIGMGYGGLLLQYYFFPENLFSLEIGSLIGAGGAGYESGNGEDENDNAHGFFLVEPEINLFWNATEFLRIGIGGSYRYTIGANIDGMSDSDY